LTVFRQNGLLSGGESVDDEDMIYWQELLDAVVAGRGNGLACPFCSGGVIEITERGRLTRLECSACHKFIEGSLQSG
jgi:hypothetical protein